MRAMADGRVPGTLTIFWPTVQSSYFVGLPAREGHDPIRIIKD